MRLKRPLFYHSRMQTANTRLIRLGKALEMDQGSKCLYAHTNKPVRLFTSILLPSPDLGRDARRIICKAEITTRVADKLHDFVVTRP